jgi:CheY-like chemotaxis protein
MTTNVWVIADENNASLIVKILSEEKSVRAQDVNFRAFTASDFLANTDVLVVDSSADVSLFGGPRNRASRGGCWLAAKLRRLGHRGPIVLLSFEPARLKRFRDSFSALDTCLALAGDEISWFAPMYDLFIRLPVAAQDMEECVSQAISRNGTRRPLLELAIARALEDHMDSEGAIIDHQWQGFQAVLRFLRGAQCEWMIHADDAMEIIEHIKSEAERQGARIHPSLVGRLQNAVDNQKQRWFEYKVLCEKMDKSPLRYADLLKDDRLVYTLLLIDDDCDSLGWQLLLRCLLAPDGFGVVADDGSTVCEKISASQSIDVILLDLKLDTLRPTSEDSLGSEGFELLSKLRSGSSIARSLPVILFTASERMSIERQRQQLGMIGYIVKSEQTEKQDARAYYRRLRSLCRAALDHELRSLLLRMAERLYDVTPSSFEKVRGKLESGLTELEDPLASCHNTGLAFEKALIDRYGPRPKGNDKLADYTEVLSDSTEYPYDEWIDLARRLRNSASHSQLGAGYINRWDAHLMAMITVVSLYRLEDISPSDLDSRTVSELLTLISRMCGDEMERLATEHSRLLNEFGLRELMLEASQLLKLSSQGKDLCADIGYCIEIIKKIANTILSYLWKNISIDTPVILLQDGLPARNPIVVPEGGAVRLTVRTIPEKVGKCGGVSDRAEINVAAGPDDNQVVIEALPTASQNDEAQCTITLNVDDGTSVMTTLRVRVEDLRGWAEASSVITADDSGCFGWTPPLAGPALLNDFRYTNEKNVKITSFDSGSGKVTGELRQGRKRGQFLVQGASLSGWTKPHRCDVLLPGAAKKQDAFMWRSLMFRDDRLKNGFDHAGIIGYTYLRSGHFIEVSDAPVDMEDISLNVLALTRFVSWALDVFLTTPNPEFQDRLKSGGGSQLIPASQPRSEPIEITEFSAAVKASSSVSIMNAGLTGIGDDVLQLLAQRMVLQRQVKEFKQRLDVSQRAVDILRTRKDNLTLQAEQISQALKDKSEGIKRNTNEKEKLKEQSDIFWAKAATMGSDISRQLEPQADRLKTLQIEIEQSESEILQLLARKESIENEKAAVEEEFGKHQSVVIPLRRLLKSRKRIATNAAGVPDTLKLIVQEGAPETLAELELVKECLRKWVWGQEREDLAGLMLDLAELWEQKGAIGAGRVTEDII